METVKNGRYHGTVFVLSFFYACFLSICEGAPFESWDLLRFLLSWGVLDLLMDKGGLLIMEHLGGRKCPGGEEKKVSEHCADPKEGKGEALKDTRDGRTGKNWFLRCFMIYMIAYIPVFLALFPGVFGYDSYKQMEFYTGLEVWSTHHPVFHTWLLGSILSLGKWIFGSYNGGVALYCALQILLAAAVFSYLLSFMREKGVKNWQILLSGLFLYAHPAILLLSFNTTKDTLFGLVFLVFVISWLRLLEGSDSKRDQALLMAGGIVSCLLRNQGIYVMAVLFMVLLAVWFFGKKPLKKAAVSMVVVLAVPTLFGFFCTGILHMPKGESREMLAVPMQQVVAVMREQEEGEAYILPEQYALAEKLHSPEAVAAYDAETADPVKGLFPSAVFNADKGAYIKNYISLGMQNHGIYTDAWLDMIRPYWNMEQSRFKGLMAELTGGSEEQWGITDDGLLGPAGTLIKSLAVQDDYRWIPFVSEVLNPGIIPWVLITVLVIGVFYQKRMALLTILPGILYFLTLLLGPVALVRYVYPLLLQIPLWIFILCWDAPVHTSQRSRQHGNPHDCGQ